MHGDEFCAVFFGDIARPARPSNHPAAAKTPNDLLSRLVAGSDSLVFDTEIAKSLQCIGTEIEPGAYFAKLRRFLIHRDLVAAPVQRQRRRRSAKPAADDDNFGHPCQGSGLRLFSRTARS